MKPRPRGALASLGEEGLVEHASSEYKEDLEPADIKLGNGDPDLELADMKTGARQSAARLIPHLYQKAVNGNAQDALDIFEAFAERSGFEKPTQKTGGTMNVLNLSAGDMSGMLEGLKQITGGSK